ncbi:MAG: sulfatase [Acidobacteria bacterium]|nr:sulfatase [Acidobacteriota bacterium]
MRLSDKPASDDHDRPAARVPGLAGRVLPRLAMAVAALTLGLATAVCSRAPAVSDWTIVLISVDTLRVDHLGTYGYDRPTSPTIDALADEGVVFEQAICQNTNTNPSHASMLSGLYPHSHGNRDNFYRMAEDVRMLPEALHEAGYKTAGFVSGYTLKDRICGLARGFDLYDDDFSGKERQGGQTTDRALAWLRTHAEDRFFLFLHLFDPHGPYDPPADRPVRFEPRGPERKVEPQRIPRYQRLPVGAPEDAHWTDLRLYEARYDEEIAYADSQVARLLDQLRQLGLREQTIILFTSDHGEALDERVHLLDHGGGIGDEEIRVPLILWLPDRRFAGQRFTGQVELIDIAPTLAALAGVDMGDGLQGVNLLPHLEGGTSDPHRSAFIETRMIPHRWRERGYRLNPRDTLKAVRRPDSKLVVFPGLPRNYIELYDLEADPAEKHNIYPVAEAQARPLIDNLDHFLALPSRLNQVASPEADPETREIFRTLGYVD